jgi:Bacterial TSP3 repeat
VSAIRNGGILIADNVVLDPNLDVDGDGIPNGWEQAHGLDPFNPNDANLDNDGDGMSNLQEFLAGTDPTNGASFFGMTAIAREGNNVRVTWAMGSGKTNSLQVATDGSGFTNDFTDLFIATDTVGSVTNYLDVSAASQTQRFYRVWLVP